MHVIGFCTRLPQSSIVKLLLSFLILPVVLSGCSMLPQRAMQADTNESQQWQIKGKLSVQHNNSNVSGYLTWTQKDDAYRILISGPFGVGASQLTGDNESASLLLPGWDKSKNASSADQLMQHYLGWSFPVAAVKYWLQGTASPEFPSTLIKNNDGQISEIQQLGWRISLSRYEMSNALWQPNLVKLKGHNYRLVLAIRERSR